MSALAFNVAIDELQRATGCDRARAEATLRRNGLLPPAPPDPAVVARDAAVLEKAEQAAIMKLLREHGFTVRSTSQARPSKIALGFYDLLCTHKARPLAFFFDTKRQVGSVWSDAQKDFAADCERCGILCYHGDRFDAQRVLDEHHIARIP